MSPIKSRECGLREVLVLLVGACVVAFVLASVWSCQTPSHRESGGSEDERFEQLNSAARTAFHQGNISLAETLYGKVLERAYMQDDLPAVVDAKYNLSLCRMRLGRYADALVTIQSAKRDGGVAPGQGSADLKLLEARILYHLGRIDAAWHISESLVGGAGASSPGIGAMAHALRGLIACDRSDIQAARAELAAMGDVSGDYLQAEHAALSGRIAMLEKDWQGAIDAFEEEISFRRRAHHYGAMAEALARAGLAWEASGDLSRAANRFFRAGRSAQIQGMRPEAFRWLTRAHELASRVGDEQTAREARERLSQMTASPSR